MTAMKDGKVYAYDPNGKELHTYDETDTLVEHGLSASASYVVLGAFEAAWNMLRWPYPNSSWWGKNKTWYKNEDAWLLDNGMGQSTVNRFLSSRGLCGAYASYMMSLFVLNPSCTAESLLKFVQFRHRQWQRESVDSKSLLRTLSKLRLFSKEDKQKMYLDLSVKHTVDKLLRHESFDCNLDNFEIDHVQDMYLAAEQCEDWPDDLKYAIRELAWEYLTDYMKITCTDTSACDDVKARIRLQMAKQGIFLNFLEVQIFSYIKYCRERFTPKVSP